MAANTVFLLGLAAESIGASLGTGGLFNISTIGNIKPSSSADGKASSGPAAVSTGAIPKPGMQGMLQHFTLPLSSFDNLLATQTRTSGLLSPQT